MNDQQAVETFTINRSEHTVGDDSCCPLWGAMRTHEDCGGLVHNEYEDEGWDYVQYRHRCDRCLEEVSVYD